MNQRRLLPSTVFCSGQGILTDNVLRPGSITRERGAERGWIVGKTVNLVLGFLWATELEYQAGI